MDVTLLEKDERQILIWIVEWLISGWGEKITIKQREERKNESQDEEDDEDQAIQKAPLRLSHHIITLLPKLIYFENLEIPHVQSLQHAQDRLLVASLTTLTDDPQINLALLLELWGRIYTLSVYQPLIDHAIVHEIHMELHRHLMIEALRSDAIGFPKLIAQIDERFKLYAPLPDTESQHPAPPAVTTSLSINAKINQVKREMRLLLDSLHGKRHVMRESLLQSALERHP